MKINRIGKAYELYAASPHCRKQVVYFWLCGRAAIQIAAVVFPTLNYFRHPGGMKALLACAAGWVAFYLADQALYNGHYVQQLGEFAGAVGAAFSFH